MSNTITIKLRNKKARTVLKGLEELKVIEIIHDEDVLKGWTPEKKQQAKDFLSAYKESKLAEQGKIKLKTADELINELKKPFKLKNSVQKNNHLNSFLKPAEE